MLEKQKHFIWDFIFISPFCLLLSAVLLGSANCHENYLCIGYPEFLRHSVYYDFFFLRTDFTQNVNIAHWSSELLIAIFPFIVLYFTKNSIFAFTVTIFYSVQHEIFWMLTLSSFGFGGTLQTTIWLMGYIAISVYVLITERRIFLTWKYLICCLSYYFYLLVQWIYWVHLGFNPNTNIGFQFDETGTISWLVWTSMILILVYKTRKVRKFS